MTEENKVIPKLAPSAKESHSLFALLVKELRQPLLVCGFLLILAIAGQAATMSHNTNQTVIVVNNSISCNLAGEHADNSYWRTFTPAFWNHTGSFAVSGVRIGIEEATAGTGGSQPITIRIYANSGGAFPSGTRTLIGTTNTTIANGTLFFQDIPVTVPAQSTSTEIVVEVFTPSGQAVGNRFFIGSNNLGQNAPSYISAVDCGAPNPVDVGAAGAPNMDTLIALIGSGPTAAGVSISGRVLTDDGRGLTNATVVLTDMQGQSQTARTGAFGYYTFDELTAGQTYVITVISKRYSYASRLVTANEVITGEDFTPEGPANRSDGGRGKPPSFSPSFSVSIP
jgi:hypothetical protein